MLAPGRLKAVCFELRMVLLHAVALVLAAKSVTLDEVKAASRQNLDAIRAEVELVKATSNITVARSPLLPQAQFRAGAGYTVQQGRQVFFTTITPNSTTGTDQYQQTLIPYAPQSIGSFSVGVAVSQLIFDGRFWAGLAQAGRVEDAAHGELEEQQLVSEFEAVSRFYLLLYSQQGRKIFEDAVMRSREQLARSQAVFSAGKGHQHDILDARTNLGNDNISLLRWDQITARYQANLNQWLAWSPEPLTVVAPSILEMKPPMPAPSLEDVLRLAKERRPIIKAIGNRVKAAEAAVLVAKSEYLPALSANALIQREAPTGALFVDSFAQRQNTVAFGANLTWNFFSGLGTTGREKYAQADLSYQQANERQALVNVETDIVSEYEVMKTSLLIADAADKNKEVAQEQVKVEEQRYLIGLGTNLDVRNAQLKLIQSQQAALQARFDVEVSRARLGRLAGVPIQGH